MHRGEQAQFVEDGRVHFLRLVDQHHRTQEGGLQVGQPALAQGLEATPAVMALTLTETAPPLLTKTDHRLRAESCSVDRPHGPSAVLSTCTYRPWR
jgi:hypothetical protein